MTIKQIIGTGLTRALGTGLIADLAGDAVAGAAKALKDHLSLDGQDLALAFQDSLSRGAAAIALGLSAEGAGVLMRLGQGTRRALAANLAQTYAARVERDFLLPYAATQGLSEQDLPVLRRQTLDLCQTLAQQRARILPPEDLDDGALAALAQGAYKEDLGALILARAANVVPDLGPRVRGLLAHQGLLRDALLFFLRERLRADPRIQAMLDALQREGLWADVRALKVAQAGDGPFLLLAAQSQALGALIDTRLADLAGALTEVGDKLDATLAAAQGARIAAKAAGSKVDAWGGQLQDDLMDLGARVEALPEAIVAVLQRVLRPGGLGCAFLCRESVKGNRQVVVKTFWRAVPGQVQETFAEAMTMNRIGGDHVPALRGYGYAPGGRRPYIVMGYLEGYCDGEAWLAEHGPLPLSQGLALGRRVLEALAAAHAAGVAHLDLKPAKLPRTGQRVPRRSSRPWTTSPVPGPPRLPRSPWERRPRRDRRRQAPILPERQSLRDRSRQPPPPFRSSPTSTAGPKSRSRPCKRPPPRHWGDRWSFATASSPVAKDPRWS